MLLTIIDQPSSTSFTNGLFALQPPCQFLAASDFHEVVSITVSEKLELEVFQSLSKQNSWEFSRQSLEEVA